MTVNTPHEPRRTIPPFTTYTNSPDYKFNSGHPGGGMVLNGTSQRCEVPSVSVKEKAKQLLLGETVSEHLTDAARHEAAARAMDQNIVTFLASVLATRHLALYNKRPARPRPVSHLKLSNRR